MTSKRPYNTTALYYAPMIGIGFAALLGLGSFFFMTKAGAAECAARDQACLLGELENVTGTIPDANWRDQTLRELAKLYSARGQVDQAIALIPRVENPDTRAMTIRGIGMEIGALKLPKDQQDKIFTTLRAEADKIDHAPSLGIALTYIAMSQAFAGDDDGAFATAQSMTNEALRHKAFAENAEIQAQMGKLDQALKSLGAITNLSFRNKAHTIVSKIFADREDYDHALTVARKVENEYQRAQSLLYILNKHMKRDAGGEISP